MPQQPKLRIRSSRAQQRIRVGAMLSFSAKEGGGWEINFLLRGCRLAQRMGERERERKTDAVVPHATCHFFYPAVDSYM